MLCVVHCVWLRVCARVREICVVVAAVVAVVVVVVVVVVVMVVVGY